MTWKQIYILNFHLQEMNEELMNYNKKISSNNKFILNNDIEEIFGPFGEEIINLIRTNQIELKELISKRKNIPIEFNLNIPLIQSFNELSKFQDENKEYSPMEGISNDFK